MAWFSGWFKKPEPEDYEEVLSALKVDIEKRRTRLSEIRLRERRATLLTTLYALAAWGVYVSLWYIDALPRFGFSRSVEHALKLALAFLGPIFVLLNRRLVQLWYTRKGDAEEKSLKRLYATQQAKIEEIKKKTNYYRTRDIIQKYDEAPSSASSPSPAQRPPQQGVPRQPVPPVTPQRSQRQPAPAAPNGLQTPLRPTLQTQLNPSPPQPLPPPRKQWFDKLADAILGDDDAPSASASRYALICQKCFAHNGLVKESMWEDAQYVCPKCGHFNPSPRSLKSGTKSPINPTGGPSPAPHTHSSPVTPPSNNSAPRQRPTPGPSNLRHVSSPTDSSSQETTPTEGNEGASMDVDS
ncbi:hypothetical protein K488DRAFT_61928 [Vararia minispora EC-137]|uniref:Uncharacterized protein n=1 Tax=Vararia minispora EC-137 TaxID=1314806 RepID=A0ACB8Q6B3_9AGAM|nr:hypothetical protein K488DRAFT_61928 [Vararia minispora EC-137]